MKYFTIPKLLNLPARWLEVVRKDEISGPAQSMYPTAHLGVSQNNRRWARFVPY